MKTIIIFLNKKDEFLEKSAHILLCSLKGLLVISLLCSTKGWAWGERGHDLVTRLACRIVLTKYKDIPEFSRPFEQKEHMLGHLSNIPDIYWKNLPKGQTLYGEPAHYIDLEYIYKTPTLAGTTPDINKNYSDIKKNCGGFGFKKNTCSGDLIEIMNKVGTVPWRIGQMATLYRDKLKEINETDKRLMAQGDAIGRYDMQKIVDQALLYAGLLSHYVGDDAQPLHVTKNYDGWDTGQGGIHAFFETFVLNSINFQLDQDALDYALKNKPAEKILSKAIEEKVVKKDEWQPIVWALALGIDSHKRLDEVLKIDKTKAIKKESKDYPLKQAALRNPPESVAKDYYPIYVERLATGADMLAYYWYEGWVQAGKPNLKSYMSFNYHFSPDFIKPDYFSGSEEPNKKGAK